MLHKGRPGQIRQMKNDDGLSPKGEGLDEIPSSEQQRDDNESNSNFGDDLVLDLGRMDEEASTEKKEIGATKRMEYNANVLSETLQERPVTNCELVARSLVILEHAILKDVDSEVRKRALEAYAEMVSKQSEVMLYEKRAQTYGYNNQPGYTNGPPQTHMRGR